jgi:hypothetical protein
MSRVLAAALVLAVIAALWFRWDAATARADADRAAERADTAEAALRDERAARKAENEAAEALAGVGAVHEEDRRDAEAVPAAVVADLRAGNLRLRNDLATCHTGRLSDAATAAGERDAGAELRAEVAGDLVRIGRDADDHVRACQAVIEQYRKLLP